MTEIVSKATMRNWNKLNVKAEERLTKRANKKLSKKRIIPIEYFENKMNITFANKLIEAYDNNQWSLEDFIYSLCILYLDYNNILLKDNVQNVLKEYNDFNLIEELQNIIFPDDEIDIIGSIYQSLLSEGKKNTIGSYYTPNKVTKNMTKDLDFSNGQTLLDPCCGSGAFLLSVENVDPNQLYGVDNDFIAIMIAKTNLLVKYSSVKFEPNIICSDYLNEDDLLVNTRFDYIITNPPWGSTQKICKKIPQIVSRETFSYFFVKSFESLKKDGIIRFLLPEAILNVKNHKDIRKYILDNCCIESFTIYKDNFTGVVTKYIDIKCRKKKQNNKIYVFIGEEKIMIDIESFFETKNNVFNFLTYLDRDILKKVRNKKKYDLSQSIWALGIVTGDNKNKITNAFSGELEEIYTGKEIQKYVIKSTENYIKYDRLNFQQVAKDEYYRSPEKLVYKFISNKLVFAYDDKQKLFLNSANILIPSIPNMSVKTVMAFLNSEMFQFLYKKLFGESKVLKGNLMELPFPEIDKKTNLKIEKLVDRIIKGEKKCEDSIQNEIFKVFGLNDDEKNYIRKVIYGKTN